MPAPIATNRALDVSADRHGLIARPDNVRSNCSSDRTELYLTRVQTSVVQLVLESCVDLTIVWLRGGRCRDLVSLAISACSSRYGIDR